MQRIFKCGNIQNIGLTPDKELNIWNAFMCHHVTGVMNFSSSSKTRSHKN